MEPGATAFDAHPGRAVGGHEPGHVRERGLGRPVGDVAPVAEPPHRGGDVDDRPVTTREQVGQRRLAEGERGRDVPVERLLERAHRRVGDRAGHRAARVVDHDVEAAELLDRRLDEALEVVEVGDVGGEDKRAPSERADLLGDLLELALRPGGDGHVGARLREGERRAGADATAGARDDGHAVGDAEPLEHVTPP